MKINVRVIFDKTSLTFEIPVGMGDKTFKWLGMVACNRFGASAPNGSLRRRDPARRGMNDNATHQPTEMALPDGQIPHPNAFLYDFLNDGDEVKIHLVDNQDLSRVDGTPQNTKWTKIAFNHKHIDDEVDGGDGSNDGNGNTDKSIVDGDTQYSPQQQQGRAQFMRILLKSQMPDRISVEEQVKGAWVAVARAMPKLGNNTKEMQEAFCESWEMLAEIFRYYSKITNGPAGRLPKEGFYRMLSESHVFPEDSLVTLYARIFDRACNAVDKSEATLSLSGLMVALILCAQTKYNDTYNESNDIVGAGAGLKDILSEHFSTIGERCEMLSMLKDEFVSTSTLNQIREWHDELFAVFNKYAGRARELPSSISYKDITDMLYDAGLTEPSETDTKGNPVAFEFDTVAALLTSVRSGLINGRPAVGDGSSEGKNDGGGSALPDDVIPDDEFTYPEMVEAICRHSFNKFRGTKPDEETGTIDYFDYVGDMTVQDCFIKGLVNVIGTLKLK